MREPRPAQFPFGNETADPARQASTHRAALAIGLTAACALVVLAGLNLSAQGLYYDEVHQAPAAFAYQGKWAPFFTMALVSGKPLMTMSYSGAIKPALYGILLRLTGASFTVESWRWFGIALVAVTFPLFSLLARSRLPAAGLVIFFALLLFDATVVLSTRHDWGPSALALALRMILLGTWLHGNASGVVKPRNSFFLGALTGLSVYEKLSNLVLLLPLLLLGLSRERRTVRHWRAAIAGLLVGGLPLVCANLLVLSQSGQLLSTRQISTAQNLSLTSLGHFLGQYLSLGDGSLIRRFILGEDRGFAGAEALLLSAALAVIMFTGRAATESRMPAILAGCYLATGAGLFLLPNNTWVHHWIIGTPFQYLAIAMAVGAPVHRLVKPPWPRLILRFGEFFQNA